MFGFRTFVIKNVNINKTESIGGSKGRVGGETSTGTSKFFQFHAVFEKFWPTRVLAPSPGGW